MKIVCPSCGAAYQVPEALLAKRHALKCSACGVKWRLAPPEAEGEAQVSTAAEAVAQTGGEVAKPSATPSLPADGTVTSPVVEELPSAPVPVAVAQPEVAVVAPPPPAPAATREEGVAFPATQPANEPEPEPTVAEVTAVREAVVAHPASPVVVSAPEEVVVVAPVFASTTTMASVPQPQVESPEAGVPPLAVHIARPAYLPTSGSFLQSVQGALAGEVRKLAATDVRALLVSERFWRGAWVVSLVLAVLVVLGAWHWWAAVVQAWPAAARLHQPG